MLATYSTGDTSMDKKLLLLVLVALMIPIKATAAWDGKPEWIEYIDYCASKFNVPSEIIRSMAFYESSWNPEAKNGNCIGLLQVNPYAHEDIMTIDTDLTNPYDCIYVGTEALAQYIEESESMTEALNKYNGQQTKKETKYSKKVLKLAEEISNEIYG